MSPGGPCCPDGPLSPEGPCCPDGPLSPEGPCCPTECLVDCPVDFLGGTDSEVVGTCTDSVEVVGGTISGCGFGFSSGGDFFDN